MATHKQNLQVPTLRGGANSGAARSQYPNGSLASETRLEDLAERVGVSRYVMSDMEKGKPTTAIAAYIGALWALGLADDLRQIADPDRDKEGKLLDNARAPTTAPKRKRTLDNDF